MNRRNFFQILPGLLAAKEIATTLKVPGPGLYVQLDKGWMSYQEAMLTRKMLAELEARVWWQGTSGLQTLSAAAKDNKTIYNEDKTASSQEQTVLLHD